MLRAAALVAAMCSATVAVAEPPGLGIALDNDELSALDYVVLPSGDGLPAGSGSVAEGEAVYKQHCLACHGEDGQDGTNDRLAGGEIPVKTVGSYWPYATTIFDYVRRAMPLTSPGILSDDELYAVTAYLLYINDIVDADATVGAETLPSVEMPNHDNFDWAL